MKVSEILYKKNFDFLNEQENDGSWDLSNPNIDELGLKANALFDFLQWKGDYQILTPEDKEKIASLKSEIERLNAEFEASDDSDSAMVVSDKISDLEDELDEYDDYIDLYDLEVEGDYYEMTEFSVSKLGNERFAVGTEKEMQDSAIEYMEQLIDDVGYEGFSKRFLENHLDTERVVERFRDIYEDDIRYNPDSYLSDSARELTDEQKERINYLNGRIELLKKNIATFEEILNRVDDEEGKKIYARIEKVEDDISQIETELSEIEDSPEGDFREEEIDQAIEDRVADVERSPLYYMDDYGMELTDYIDKDSLIKDAVDEDGYGIVNPYDGSVEDIFVNGKLFYVFRKD
jgi:predicted  nucleic acid-binding Zn-ribbon protein